MGAQEETRAKFFTTLKQAAEEQGLTHEEVWEELRIALGSETASDWDDWLKEKEHG